MTRNLRKTSPELRSINRELAQNQPTNHQTTPFDFIQELGQESAVLFRELADNPHTTAGHIPGD